MSWQALASALLGTSLSVAAQVGCADAEGRRHLTYRGIDNWRLPTGTWTREVTGTAAAAFASRARRRVDRRPVPRRASSHPGC
jgi:hypothetical protein